MNEPKKLILLIFKNGGSIFFFWYITIILFNNLAQFTSDIYLLFLLYIKRAEARNDMESG